MTACIPVVALTAGAGHRDLVAVQPEGNLVGPSAAVIEHLDSRRRAIDALDRCKIMREILATLLHIRLRHIPGEMFDAEHLRCQDVDHELFLIASRTENREPKTATPSSCTAVLGKVEE